MLFEAQRAKAAPPGQIVFVIDRSRSVGLAGLAAERDFARAVLETLPGDTRFNAVFFAREPTPLFPVAREATRAAISALETGAAPGLMANGTDLRAALALAVRAASAFIDATPTWVFVLTDGSIGDVGGDLAESPLPVATIVIRPDGDDPVPPENWQRLAVLSARSGGIARQVSPAHLAQAARDAVAGMSVVGKVKTKALTAVPIAAAASPTTAADPLRGQMDPQVLRNALTLTYLPRARACYLGRPVKNTADMELRGRLRLELHIERGEIRDAVIRASTLSRPDIESCLREAAFEAVVPRPMRSEGAVVANLNMVFQPATAPKADGGVATEFSRQIDLILGRITFSTDFTDLLGKP